MPRHFEDHNERQQQGLLKQPRNFPGKKKTFHVRLIRYGRRGSSVVSALDSESSGLGSTFLWWGANELSHDILSYFDRVRNYF